MPRRYSSTAVAPRRASASPRRASYCSTLRRVERTWTETRATSGTANAAKSATKRGSGDRGRTSFTGPTSTKGPCAVGPGTGCRSVPVLRLPAVHAVLEKPEEMPHGAEGIERAEAGPGHPDDASVLRAVERGNARQPALLAPEPHVLDERRAVRRDHPERPSAGARELRLRV